MSAALLLLLGKEIAVPVARGVIKRLSAESRGAHRLEQSLELARSGMSTVAAMRSVFGEDFAKALAEASATGRTGWSFEAGRKEYVRLSGTSPKSLAARLAFVREELNLNLDRISAFHEEAEKNSKKYARGLFAEWRLRYAELIGEDRDSIDTFKAVEKLLDDTRKSYATALRIMQVTSLGSVGAVLVVYGLMVGTATGMGVFAAISAWLVGVPFIAAATAVVPGVILLALASVSLKDKDAVSAAVQVAYRLLDRRLARASGEKPAAQVKTSVRPPRSSRRAS